MSKSDRLLNLLDHVRRFGPVELEELAKEFKVSVRTIYRDLRTLATSSHPLKFTQGKGFVLVSQEDQELLQLNKNDKDLILFCLFNNPLNMSPFLKERILKLRNYFESQADDAVAFGKQPLFRFHESFSSLNVEHLEIVEKFLFAFFKKLKVFLLESGNFQKTDALIPVGIRFESTGGTLALFNDVSMKDFLVDIDKLQGISISTQRFVNRPIVIMDSRREDVGV